MFEKLEQATKEFEDKIASIFQEYLDQYQEVKIGTKFIYESEECEVTGAGLRFGIEEILTRDLPELNPDFDIIYYIDIPSWRLPSQPESKAVWIQGSSKKVLKENN